MSSDSLIIYRILARQGTIENFESPIKNKCKKGIQNLSKGEDDWKTNKLSKPAVAFGITPNIDKSVNTFNFSSIWKLHIKGFEVFITLLTAVLILKL